jgi:hypothetical protein
MTRPRAALPIALAVLTAVAVACSPKAGGSCKAEGKEVCEGKQAALACLDGKWEPLKCKGAKGCVTAADGDTCDQTVTEEGDACSLENDNSCTSDKRSVVVCRGRKWTKSLTCAGPGGCERADKDVKCDNTVASLGDLCNIEKDLACSADKKATLVCRGGKFEVGTPCKGPKLCVAQSGKINCDDSLADLNDPCEKKPTDEKYACSTDAKNILKCDGAKFIQFQPCKGKETCKVQPDGVGCGT